MARVFVARGVWLNDLTLDEYLSVYSMWQKLHDSATKGESKMATEYAREILRTMTDAKWWPEWRIRKMFRRVLEAAGIGRQAPPDERNGDKSIQTMRSLINDLAGRARKTPLEIARGMRPAELGPFAASLYLAELRDSQNRVRDQHYSPKDRMKDLDKAIKKIQGQLRAESAKVEAPKERPKLRLINTEAYSLSRPH